MKIKVGSLILAIALLVTVTLTYANDLEDMSETTETAATSPLFQAYANEINQIGDADPELTAKLQRQQELDRSRLDEKTDKYIIKYKSSAQAMALHGAQDMNNQFEFITLDEPQTPSEVQQTYANDNRIEYIQPDYVVGLCAENEMQPEPMQASEEQADSTTPPALQEEESPASVVEPEVAAAPVQEIENGHATIVGLIDTNVAFIILIWQVYVRMVGILLKIQYLMRTIRAALHMVHTLPESSANRIPLCRLSCFKMVKPAPVIL